MRFSSTLSPAFRWVSSSRDDSDVQTDEELIGAVSSPTRPSGPFSTFPATPFPAVAPSPRSRTRNHLQRGRRERTHRSVRSIGRTGRDVRPFPYLPFFASRRVHRQKLTPFLPPPLDAEQTRQSSTPMRRSCFSSSLPAGSGRTSCLGWEKRSSGRWGGRRSLGNLTFSVAVTELWRGRENLGLFSPLFFLTRLHPLMLIFSTADDQQSPCLPSAMCSVFVYPLEPGELAAQKALTRLAFLSSFRPSSTLLTPNPPFPRPSDRHNGLLLHRSTSSLCSLITWASAAFLR